MNKNLSLIIPMYNASSFIGRCLESILEQGIDASGYEIIIVNDGSKDDSLAIVEEFKKNHSNIKIVSQKNQGQSVARNRGIREATGKYLWFIDADDFLIPKSLKGVYDTVFGDGKNKDYPKYEGIDIITFDVVRGPDKVFITLPNVQSNPIYAPILKGSDFMATFPKRFPNGPWWYFIRKKFVEENSLFFQEGKLLEDGLFIITALLKASSVGHISQALYYYALRPGSTMYTYTPEQLEKINDGFRNAISYLTSLLEKNKKEMGQACYDRLIARRNAYIVFLLIRLLKFGTPEYAKETIAKLETKNLYPIKKLIGKDYNNWRMRLLYLFINRKALYLLSCKLYVCFNSLRHKHHLR